MPPESIENRIVRFQRIIEATPEVIFEAIADPARQPMWDGNDNLENAAPGQRITSAGQSFLMKLRNGKERTNYVDEFSEGRLIAWKPAPVGEEPRGHIWRWELEPEQARADGTPQTRVIHTYDWTALTDPTRFKRARATTEQSLAASVDRLAEHLAEHSEQNYS